MLYKVGNICIDLYQWQRNALWKTLEWKIDQFSLNQHSDENNAEIDFKCSREISRGCNQENETKYLLKKEPMGFFEWNVYISDNNRIIWMLIRRSSGKICLKYIMNDDWKKVSLIEDETESGCHVPFEYLGKIMPGVFLKHDLISFHGVLMEHNGNGVIISAASGMGKTTHARLWRDYKNALIINGDRAVCKHTDKGWIGYGTPWSGTSGEQINRSVPLKALVVLERSQENSAEVIYGMEAFGAVFPHILYPSWDRELTEKAMDLLEDFMNHIPIIRLRCRPDVESVDVLNQVLEEL